MPLHFLVAIFCPLVAFFCPLCHHVFSFEEEAEGPECLQPSRRVEVEVEVKGTVAVATPVAVR